MSRRKSLDTQGVGVEGDDHPLHRGVGRGGGGVGSIIKNIHTPKNIKLSEKKII